MEIEFKMPDLATTDSAMKVVRWLAGAGEPIKRGQPLLEVETDKATMEVESIATGKLRALRIQPGEEVTSGQTIAILETEDRVGTAVFAPPAEPAALQGNAGGMFAKNRSAAVKPAASAPANSISPSPAQRTVGRRMLESKQTVPHFYLQTSANAEPMLARRNTAAPVKTVWDAFFVHAVGKALKKYERMNFRFDADRLLPSGVNAVGVAVDHEGELFVIPIADPAAKPPERISEEIRALVGKLRSGDADVRNLRPANMTVTNLGAANIEAFTAIINPPESAILAIGKISPVAVVRDGKVAPQSRVRLTLSVDHRVVNGSYAAEFFGAVVEELERL